MSTPPPHPVRENEVDPELVERLEKLKPYTRALLLKTVALDLGLTPRVRTGLVELHKLVLSRALTTEELLRGLFLFRRELKDVVHTTTYVRLELDGLDEYLPTDHSVML